MLGFARREGPCLSTVLFAGREQAGEWRARIAPGPVRHLAACGARAWLLVGGAVYETCDAGLTFTTFSLPSRPHSVLAAASDGPWVASDAQVLAREGDAWSVRWEIPALLPEEAISRLVPSGREVFVLTNRLRVLRGAADDRSLRDYGEGLPAPLSGGTYATVNLQVLDDWRLAYAGGLYLRHADDARWTPATDREAPDLAGVMDSQSADWVLAPWSKDIWIGHDASQIFASGPGRPLSRLWRLPVGAPQTLKRLVTGRETVFVSLRRATSALSGLAITEGGVEELALPVD